MNYKIFSKTKIFIPIIILVLGFILYLPSNTLAVSCGLATKQAYKTNANNAIYYITPECTKRPFKSSIIFYTYFNSFSDVKITTDNLLNKIANDKLGFMPWGPKYDPKYGALVKIPSDPKVYLLLNNKKYWIKSETVFNALLYPWNWIEDVDADLLNKYIEASEITYKDHHPEFTIIKYKNSNKVYRLEYNQTGVLVKNHIKDETAFKKLQYRWDRILTINDLEVYPDSKPFVSEIVNNILIPTTTKPVVVEETNESASGGGGGGSSWQDCQDLFQAGADAVSFGSVHILQPWKPTLIVRQHSKNYTLIYP